jgi:hypothetical protein
MSWSKPPNWRLVDIPGLLVPAGEGVMKFSSIGRSNVRAVWGGVLRVGAVIGDDVSGEALSCPPIEAKESLFERGWESVSSQVNSPRSAAIDWYRAICESGDIRLSEHTLKKSWSLRTFLVLAPSQISHPRTTGLVSEIHQQCDKLVWGSIITREVGGETGSGEAYLCVIRNMREFLVSVEFRVPQISGWLGGLARNKKSPTRVLGYFLQGECSQEGEEESWKRTSVFMVATFSWVNVLCLWCIIFGGALLSEFQNFCRRNPLCALVAGVVHKKIRRPREYVVACACVSFAVIKKKKRETQSSFNWRTNLILIASIE